MNDLDDFSYDNEEEAEMGQLHAIHLNMNAVADVQRALAKQVRGPSLSHCEECGEEIPEARQRLMPGVRMCVWCKEIEERRH